MRTAISAAIINEDKELLLVKKKETRILPGGKPEPEESELDCLKREINEELNGATIDNPLFFESFIGETPHKGDLLEAKVYFVELITDTLQASAELSEAKFVKDFENYKLSDITNKIIQGLKETGNL